MSPPAMSSAPSRIELIVAGSGIIVIADIVKSPECVLWTEPPPLIVDCTAAGVIPESWVVNAPIQFDVPVVSLTVPVTESETDVPVGVSSSEKGDPVKAAQL